MVAFLVEVFLLIFTVHVDVAMNGIDHEAIHSVHIIVHVVHVHGFIDILTLRVHWQNRFVVVILLSMAIISIIGILIFVVAHLANGCVGRSIYIVIIIVLIIMRYLTILLLVRLPVRILIHFCL